MKPGQAVTVSGIRCTMPCRVIVVAEPASLPQISADLPVEIVRAILAELDVSRVALIAYDVGNTSYTFVALETPTGWQDLTSQRLTITIPEDS